MTEIGLMGLPGKTTRVRTLSCTQCPKSVVLFESKYSRMSFLANFDEPRCRVYLQSVHAGVQKAHCVAFSCIKLFQISRFLCTVLSSMLCKQTGTLRTVRSRQAFDWITVYIIMLPGKSTAESMAKTACVIPMSWLVRTSISGRLSRLSGS